MIAYVFPGQGSQHKGMGGELFDEFSELTAKADKILGYSIKELCINDPDNVLGNTQYTQPALYVVNALTYLKKVKETGEKGDFVAGHSLGEYVALFAAGVFNFETGLKLVQKRGALMSQASGGGMAAVIGLTEEKVNEVLVKNNMQGIDVANFNTLTQIVLSGTKEDIELAKPFFEAEGVRNYVILKVSGAFHSRYMADASERFGEFLDEFEFSEIKIPIISNVFARPYKQKDIKNSLVLQIKSSVKWTESIRYLMGKGVTDIVQVGPGTVLSGLVRTIQRECESLIVNEEEEKKTEAEVVETTEVANTSSASRENIEASEDNAKEKEKNGKNKRKNTENKAKLTKVESDNVKANSEFTKPNKSVIDVVAVAESNGCIKEVVADTLGSSRFRNEYKLKYAYVQGGMYRGISSKELVVKMAKAGMLGFFGTGGLKLSEVEDSIEFIRNELGGGESFGMNLLCNLYDIEKEEMTVDLFLKHNIDIVEASAYMSLTPALVRYRLNGISKGNSDDVQIKNRVIAKVSRPDIAEMFLSPAPERIVKKLLEENRITVIEAELSRYIPMADDICVEGDSGGHTDGGSLLALFSTMVRLRNEICDKHHYTKIPGVGAAGGIGTPEAVAAMFAMGADFILTGSINQCTVQAGICDTVKDMLQQANVQDTGYAPSGDMFEFGAKVQVLKKGVFFHARANKLYEMYKQYNSLGEIDKKTREQLEEKYFKRSLVSVYEECKMIYPKHEIEKAEKNPKSKMALVFKYYFYYATQNAFEGRPENIVDFQVQCSHAMGAFNNWVKGTALENWRERNVDEIAIMIMNEAANYLNQRFKILFNA